MLSGFTKSENPKNTFVLKILLSRRAIVNWRSLKVWIFTTFCWPIRPILIVILLELLVVTSAEVSWWSHKENVNAYCKFLLVTVAYVNNTEIITPWNIFVEANNGLLDMLRKIKRLELESMPVSNLEICFKCHLTSDL